MPADVPVVEILDAEVIDNLKQQDKTAECKVQPVLPFTYAVLYTQVYAENEQRLDEHIDEHQKKDVEEEFSVHRLVDSRLLNSVAHLQFVQDI